MKRETRYLRIVEIQAYGILILRSGPVDLLGHSLSTPILPQQFLFHLSAVPVGVMLSFLISAERKDNIALILCLDCAVNHIKS